MLLAAADVPHHASRPALADPRAPVPVRVFQPLPPFPAPVGDHFVPGYPPHGHLIPAPALNCPHVEVSACWGLTIHLPVGVTKKPSRLVTRVIATSSVVFRGWFEKPGNAS
ncbi:unnamed protein product [Notodromas monacha]|uniref:Uncharacterized protein n=1 Tax=Notodromas monacha TaxID=399045 RepID=A0A7R9BF39_9CRUS|nr:unnamed protein product [Notodromas monacha]CAG0912655.1 unnamed protein product [Notodromas monacha]